MENNQNKGSITIKKEQETRSSTSGLPLYRGSSWLAGPSATASPGTAGRPGSCTSAVHLRWCSCVVGRRFSGRSGTLSTGVKSQGHILEQLYTQAHISDTFVGVLGLNLEVIFLSIYTSKITYLTSDTFMGVLSISGSSFVGPLQLFFLTMNQKRTHHNLTDLLGLGKELMCVM